MELCLFWVKVLIRFLFLNLFRTLCARETILHFRKKERNDWNWKNREACFHSCTIVVVLFAFRICFPLFTVTLGLSFRKPYRNKQYLLLKVAFQKERKRFEIVGEIKKKNVIHSIELMDFSYFLQHGYLIGRVDYYRILFKTGIKKILLNLCKVGEWIVVE